MMIAKQSEKTMKNQGYNSKLSHLKIGEFGGNQGHDFGKGRTRRQCAHGA